MGVRSKIIERAEFWASPGEWKPIAEDLVYFFENAGTEAAPTTKEAQAALDAGGTGVKVQGVVKHWCGIFACSCIREAGLTTPRWTLLGGKIKNLPIVMGHSGLQAGDIAMITSGNHHFIVTSIDGDTMTTVEGNTLGQYIRERTRKVSEPYAYYRVSD